MESFEDKNEYILEVRNICKNFGGVRALDNVNLKVKKGEVLAIVGDNGAGKSTLIKIISGVIQKDSGEIVFEDKKAEINSPVDAKKLGIETVYQDLALIDIFNIPLNIFLGRESIYDNVYGKITKAVNFKKMYDETLNLFNKYPVYNLKNVLEVMTYNNYG
ncbi:MAG: ATP-binding cassette domain-containing protein [Actinobacteria bacterium]|nr:ATP-binding cassette domain-containing protein [Actinomycetota bacterium]